MKRIAVLLLMTFVACWFVSVSAGLAVPLPPEMSLDKTGISVEITWTPSEGADGYRLYYAPYPYTGPTSIGSIDMEESTEIDFTLWEGASYYVAVTAYDDTGESRYSNSELFLLGPYTTDHTEGTPELSIDTDALEVSTSWTEVTGATSYRLYYAPYPFTDSDAIGNFDMGDSTEADFTLWDGAAFYVAMTAEENGNESGFSNVELLLTGNPVPEWQNTGYTDTDNDGYSLDEGDCDDGDQTVYPGADEICGDEIDQDCDGEAELCPVDPNDVDDDNDGFTENQGDCDDADLTINPDATDVCGDDIDQDCSGVDEFCTVNTNIKTQKLESSWTVSPWDYYGETAAQQWHYISYTPWDPSLGTLLEVTITVSISGERAISTETLYIRTSFFTGWSPADYQFSDSFSIPPSENRFEITRNYSFSTPHELANWLTYDYLPQANHYFESKTITGEHTIDALTTIKYIYIE